MTLQIFQQYPDLKDFLDTITDFIVASFEVDSIILYGGITLNDFSPRYSDIDLVVVLRKSLWGKDYDTLEDILSQLSKRSLFTTQLDLLIAPRTIIENPRVNFSDVEGVKIEGNSQEIISHYPLSQADSFMIRNHGVVLYGEDLRIVFPIPGFDCFWEQFITDLYKIEQQTRKYPFQDFLASDKEIFDLFLYFPRMLYSLKERDVIGKFQSAYWFSNEYSTNLSDFLLELAFARKKGQPINTIIDLADKGAKLIAFSLEQAFKTRNLRCPDFNELIDKKDGKYSFTKMFIEARNCTE